MRAKLKTHPLTFDLHNESYFILVIEYERKLKKRRNLIIRECFKLRYSKNAITKLCYI